MFFAPVPTDSILKNLLDIVVNTNTNRNISRSNTIYQYALFTAIFRFSVYGGRNTMGTDKGKARQQQLVAKPALQTICKHFSGIFSEKSGNFARIFSILSDYFIITLLP